MEVDSQASNKSPFRLFFISTNQMWSGSEILWYESALRCMNIGHSVSIAVAYQHPKIDLLKSRLISYVNLKRRWTKLPIAKRGLNKILRLFNQRDLLQEAIEHDKPQIVIISQGADFGSVKVMDICSRLEIPFVTVTQLVTELHWTLLSDENYSTVRNVFNRSLRNYFVSHQNLRLHEAMLADHAGNNEVIYNPAIINRSVPPTYPKTNAHFRIAFVGRLDCLHKGLDLLVQLASMEKWQARPIEFGLYGSGPHARYINAMMYKQKRNNIFIHSYQEDVANVWAQNHLMILPSRMEGQSLALLEAIACERSAVITDVGGAKEIIEDNVTGFIARVPSLQDLDEAMERAWRCRDQWREMGVAARKHMLTKMPADSIDFFLKKVLHLIH